jgi:hypothetical protein
MIDLRCLVVALSLLLSSQALADKPKFGDTLSFHLGGMDHNADVSFSSTRDGREPVVLDLDDLGMDKSAGVLWLGLDWQFADSWGVNFSYTDYDGDGIVTASEEGNFGDIEWTADAALDSYFDLKLFIVDFHWDFINTERSHFGVGVGLHVADIDSGIAFSLDGNVNGQVIEIDSGFETATVTAPLPNVSLRAGHRFGEKWYLSGTQGYFDLTVDNVNGELITARGSLEWRAFKNFGFGLGYQYVTIDVKEDESDRQNRIDADFYGPVLFVSAAF